MLKDTLRDSWTYQKVLGEGIEEGIEKGIEKGRIEEARGNIELFVEKRFPTLLTWVKAQIEQISDLEILQGILPALFAANTPEEIEMALSSSR